MLIRAERYWITVQRGKEIDVRFGQCPDFQNISYLFPRRNVCRAMRTLTTLLSLALCYCARADVIVYKVTGTYTVSGGGTVSRGTAQGWIVIDPQTKDDPTLRCSA